MTTGIGACAMILAAGKGTRMGVLSDALPKPLTTVKGCTLMDRLLGHLKAANTRKVVVNVHHLADQIEDHLKNDIDAQFVTISDERSRLLETGGGVKKALSFLGSDPFLVINGDALWIDSTSSNLSNLKHHWDSNRMDILLLLVKREAALGYDGSGDFFMANEGTQSEVGALKFRGDEHEAPYVFCGVQIVHPDQYDDTPEGPWSNVELFKKAAEKGRLYGLLIDGHWMHVGTPDAIVEAEAKLDALGVL